MSTTKQIIKEIILEAKKKKSSLLSFPLNEVSVMKNKYPFKVVFIFGPVGAGKTFIKNFMKLPPEFIDVSADERLEDIFQRFGISLKFAHDIDEPTPETENLKQVQLKTRAIAQNAARGHMANLINKGTPIVIDTTGHEVEKLTKRIEALAHIGYDVAVIQINVPTTVSVRRDAARERTLGKTITTDVSKEFQSDVVAAEGYFEQLRALPDVTLLGNEIFPNIFCLSQEGCEIEDESGNLVQLKYGGHLPGITNDAIEQEFIDSEGNAVKLFADATLQKAEAILNRIRSDTANFLSGAGSGPINPRGRKLFKGMRSLVTLSGGELGQNFTDIIPALGVKKFADDNLIVAAAQELADVSDIDLQAVLPSEKMTPAGPPGKGGEILPQQKPEISTVRGLTGLKEVIKLELQNDPRFTLKQNNES